MRFALIHPPQGYATGRKPNIDERLYLFPPAIPSLGAAAEGAGWEAAVVDFPVLRWQLRDYEQWLEHWQPDVVGLSVCSPSMPYAQALMRATKRLAPHTRVVIGGPHATFSPDELLQPGLADYVVRYDGEQALAGLLGEIAIGREGSTTPGVSFRTGEGPVHNPPAERLQSLDELGMPAYHLLDIGAYLERLNRITISSTRGCPFDCTFCTIPGLMGQQVRGYSPEVLVATLRHLVDTYGARRYTFTDPNFAISIPRLRRLRELFREQGLEISFGCQSRLFTLTDEALGLLRDLGCVCVLVGVESGSDTVLEHFHKTHEKERQVPILDRIARVKEAGIDVLPSLILGSPEETRTDLDASLVMIEELVDGLDIRGQTQPAGGNFQINMFGPFPGVDADAGLPLELPLHYAPALPVSGTHHVGKPELDSVWDNVYAEYYEDFLEPHRQIVHDAARGIDRRYAAFVEGATAA